VSPFHVAVDSIDHDIIIFKCSRGKDDPCSYSNRSITDTLIQTLYNKETLTTFNQLESQFICQHLIHTSNKLVPYRKDMKGIVTNLGRIIFTKCAHLSNLTVFLHHAFTRMIALQRSVKIVNGI
jgi:hypothetical protein